MNDEINSAECTFQSSNITNISNEITQLRIVEALPHLELLKFVARVNNQALEFVVSDKPSHEGMSERPRPTGYKDGRSIERPSRIVDFSRHRSVLP